MSSEHFQGGVTTSAGPAVAADENDGARQIPAEQRLANAELHIRQLWQCVSHAEGRIAGLEQKTFWQALCLLLVAVCNLLAILGLILRR